MFNVFLQNGKIKDKNKILKKDNGGHCVGPSCEDFDDFDNDDAQDQLNLFVQKLYALKYTMCTRQLNLIFQTNKEFFQAEDYNQCSLKVKIWKNLKTYLNFYFFSKENRFPEAWCYNIYSFLHIHRMKDN